MPKLQHELQLLKSVLTFGHYMKLKDKLHINFVVFHIEFN